MKSANFRVLNQICVRMFCAVCVVISLTSVLIAQSAAKANRMIIHQKYPEQPVTVGELRVSDTKVQSGSEFSYSDDWLKALSFDVRNTSGKTITYIQMRLIFDPSGEGVPASFPIVRGVDSLHTGETSPSLNLENNPRAIAVRPGDSVRLQFDEQAYAGLSKFLSKVGFTRGVYKARLIVATVLFEDGSIWMGGSMKKRDPNNPQRLVPISTAKSVSWSDNGQWKPVMVPASYSAFGNRKERAIPNNSKTNVKVSSPTSAKFDIGCTREVEVYTSYCGINAFHQCYWDSFASYATGGLRWEDMSEPCYDYNGYYCESESTVRRITPGQCYYVMNPSSQKEQQRVAQASRRGKKRVKQGSATLQASR